MNIKRILSAMISVLVLVPFLPAATAAAATTLVCGVEVKGAILATALKAAGPESGAIESKLGCPSGPETKITVLGRNTYHQHFDLATVYWDGAQGGKWWGVGKVPPLSGVSNERGALAGSGLPGGMIYRSAKLCNASTNDKRLMTAMLHGGTIIDLRTASAVSGCKDPTLPGVSRFSRPMTSTTNLSSFITSSKDRAAVKAVLEKIAAEDGPIWIHCTRGRDRTGFVVIVLGWIGGVSNDLIRAEYLRTTGTSGATYDKAIRLMNDTYDGAEGFLFDGIGISPETYEKLQEELTS